MEGVLADVHWTRRDRSAHLQAQPVRAAQDISRMERGRSVGIMIIHVLEYKRKDTCG